MPSTWETLKLFADPTRLRVLALLRDEALSVAELQEILAMGQSRISSHLALLRQASLVEDRREGKKTFYSLHPGMEEAQRSMLEAACAVVEREKDFQNDRKNLQRILEKRRRFAEEYFNLIAGRLGKNYCPGRSWEGIGHALLALTPPVVVADLGAGEGLIGQLLARRAREVICIDNAPRMVEVGTELARKNKLANLSYKLGDIEDVPLTDGSVDLAILSQALHHARRPEKALREAFRILRPGGRLVILDLLEHQFEKARELYADIWLGFSENTLYGYLRETGFKDIEVTPLTPEDVPPHFTTLVATATRSPTPARR